MGAPSLEVGYTSATTGRGDHEVHKGHVVALGKKKELTIPYFLKSDFQISCLMCAKFGTIISVQSYCEIVSFVKAYELRGVNKTLSRFLQFSFHSENIRYSTFSCNAIEVC
jgi:hypothetical protein